jgi:uncharacterized protein YceH (UPF0502 family)
LVGALEVEWDESWQRHLLVARIERLTADSAAQVDSAAVVVGQLEARVAGLRDSAATWQRAYEVMRRQRDILAGLVP